MQSLLHRRLSESFHWYKNWHSHLRHYHAHWAVFLIAVTFVFSLLSSQINNFYSDNGLINTALAQTNTCVVRPAPRPLPNMESVVQQVAADHPDWLANSCQDQGGTWQFMDEVVSRLRQTDTRWAYNGKRGNINDPSHDAIAYYYGDGNSPVSGSIKNYEVYVVDIISGHCGSSPGPTWNDVTQVTWDGGTTGAYLYPRTAGGSLPPLQLCSSQSPSPSPSLSPRPNPTACYPPISTNPRNPNTKVLAAKFIYYRGAANGWDEWRASFNNTSDSCYLNRTFNPNNILGPESWRRDVWLGRLNDYPVLGAIDESNPGTIRWEIRTAKSAGIDAFILYLTAWPENRPVIQTYLNIAQEEGFKIAISEHNVFNISLTDLINGTSTVLNTFKNHPAYLRMKDKPVYFIPWGQDPRSCESPHCPSDLKTLNDGIEAQVGPVYLVESRNQTWPINVDIYYFDPILGTTGHDAYTNWVPIFSFVDASGRIPNNRQQLFQKFVDDSHSIGLDAILPLGLGYSIEKWNSCPSAPDMDPDGVYTDNFGASTNVYQDWRKRIQEIFATNPEAVYIHAWNEWHEGSQIAPSWRYKTNGQENPFKFLNVLAQERGLTFQESNYPPENDLDSLIVPKLRQWSSSQFCTDSGQTPPPPGPVPTGPPIINEIIPTTVSAGSTLEIYGTDLGPTVQFTDSSGQITTVLGFVEAGYGIVSLTIPSTLQPGLYTVGITTPLGSATSSTQLSVIKGTPDFNPPPGATSIPGATSFQELISGVFNYAVMLVGIAAFIVIMWAGFLWTTSAANPGNIARAKGMIFNAIAGVILLLSSYVILYTINPELVGGTFNLPGISQAPPPPQQPPPETLCPKNLNNLPDNGCAGCVIISTGIPIKSGVGDIWTPNPKVTASVETALVLLQEESIRQGIANQWQVTEAYCPTVSHLDQNHYDGRAVDIALLTSSKTVANVKKLCLAATASGFSITNEYVSMGSSTTPECPAPLRTSTTTGDHLHLESGSTPPSATCPIGSPISWTSQDPYGIDWSNTKPELRSAYDAFNAAIGRTQGIISIWRPQTYQDHIRTNWDAWQLVNGQTFTINDSSCSNNGTTITPPSGWQNCSSLKQQLSNEAQKHSFSNTRPACTSDHIQGIAIDIQPPATTGPIYTNWINTAASLSGDLRLCHYIAGDEPHFGLTKYLPAGTNCLRQ